MELRWSPRTYPGGGLKLVGVEVLLGFMDKETLERELEEVEAAPTRRPIADFAARVQRLVSEPDADVVA